MKLLLTLQSAEDYIQFCSVWLEKYFSGCFTNKNECQDRSNPRWQKTDGLQQILHVCVSWPFIKNCYEEDQVSQTANN